MHGHEQYRDEIVSALNLAQKSAVTGALKRALRLFGNLFGNSLYDVFHINKLDTNSAKFPDRITFDLLMKEFEDKLKDDDKTLKTDGERKEKAPKNPNGREIEEKTENKPIKKETKPEERETKPEGEDEINDDDIAQFWPFEAETLPEQFKKNN